jgi:hypothetical protein
MLEIAVAASGNFRSASLKSLVAAAFVELVERGRKKSLSCLSDLG